MMNLRITALGTILATASFLTGCAKPAPAVPTGPPASVYFLQPDSSTPWGKLYDKQMAASAQQHPELKLTELDAGGDAKKQISQISEAIAKKPRVLMVSPVADSVLPELAKARNAGIFVFLLDRWVKVDPADAYVGEKDFDAGEAFGIIYGRSLHETGPVLIIPGKANPATQPWRSADRLAGFIAGFKKFNIPVTVGQDCGGSEDKTRDFVTQFLATKKPCTAIVAVNDEMALGAAEAVKAANATGIKYVVGIGADEKKVFDAVKSGALFATITNPPAGPTAMDYIPDLVQNGRKPPKESEVPDDEVRADTEDYYLAHHPILAD
jgi:ribose transport system substrate-binding protein